MTIDWREVLTAYLHDPPDKALDIRNHQSRSRRHIEAGRLPFLPVLSLGIYPKPSEKGKAGDGMP